ncbi:hypothetical protein HYT53_02215, partial [Candidatus Woesearchaeota archaeon]|nr:hypothetical protein [Candidatus Woesearchaeota archaeon]
MKRMALFIMVAMFAALAGAAVDTSYYGESPSIVVSLASQEPDPVEPGNIAEVSFKLDNQGALAKEVVFEIFPEYPFSMLPGESASKNVGTLGTAQDTATSVFVKYKVKVDQHAVDGSHEIRARYKSSGFNTWVTVKDLKVKVQSKDAILSVEKFSTIPEFMPPGSKARLMIELKNYATSLLKDVKVSLELGKSGDE